MELRACLLQFRVADDGELIRSKEKRRIGSRRDKSEARALAR